MLRYKMLHFDTLICYNMKHKDKNLIMNMGPNVQLVSIIDHIGMLIDKYFYQYEIRAS